MGMMAGLPGGSDDGDGDASLAVINTTPLVDVMLVLLIIFLITVPVALQVAPLSLPRVNSQPVEIRPGTVSLGVAADGSLYWNDRLLGRAGGGHGEMRGENQGEIRGEGILALRPLLQQTAALSPRPPVHLRADRAAAWAVVARVVADCRDAGLETISLVTSPEPPAARPDISRSDISRSGETWP